MVIIKATCSACGTVEVGSADVELRVAPDGTDLRSWYSFGCPRCAVTVQRLAISQVVSALVKVGVEARALSFHPEGAHRLSFPAFTQDDVLRFHELLEEDERWRSSLR